MNRKNTPPVGFHYEPEFLDVKEHTALFERVKELTFDHPEVRGHPLKRGYVQYGSEYITATKKLKPAPPLPEFLVAIVEKARPHCPECLPFNQCIITYYPKGAQFTPHIDKPCFGDCIFAVSLGAAARFQFQPADSDETCYELGLAPGSLYVMSGPARWDYKHGLPELKATRYSLTFRHVLEGAPNLV